MTDVTVIIPVRDRPRLLQEALRSVLAGLALPDEVIVVLDGTPGERRADENAVRALHAEFLEKQTRLTLIETPGLGPAAARNLGAARARTQLLAFLDSDDLWQPGKLYDQLDYMRRRPHLHASHCAETWIKHGQPVPVPSTLQPAPGRRFMESLDHCTVSASSVMISRKTFFSLSGFDRSLRACEDYDLWIRFFLRHPMGMVPPLPEPHVIKRSGSWSQLSSTRSMDLYRVQSLTKLLLSEELTTVEQRHVLDALEKKWKIITAQKKKYGFPDSAQFHSLEEKIKALSARLRDGI